LWFDEVLPDLRLLSIHNPEKKDNTISAIAEAAILGFSASMLDVLQDEATQRESVSGLPMFGDSFPA
jgi:hypothetical protein